MLDGLLALIAPHICLQCGAEGTLWCHSCRLTAPQAPERCYKCHRLSSGGRTCTACRRVSALYGVQAATRYEGYAKQLIWQLKFERARAAASVAGDLMAHRLRMVDGLVLAPVPAVTNHVRRRGYDQSVLIARRLAARTGVPCCSVLLRLGQRQQRTATRKQRMTQLAGAFQAAKPQAIRGKHIILVDDVITTGATLEAAARALKDAGAKRVSAVVFAQA